ncbi:MAG: hypothetical protein HYX92_12880 [Chloroflexi bacterium]|nr:hypothetical protein [Chloroflexota bacterium]
MQATRHYMLLSVQVLTVLGLALAGCAPAVAPAPTAKPAAPAAAKAPTAAPAKPAPPTPQPAAPTSSPKPAAEQPRRGGTLFLNEAGDPPNFDAHSAPGVALLHPVMPVYNGLVQYDPLDPSKVIGDLAKTWEYSTDGKLLTFHLLEGVKWHDGKAFAAPDAKFSLERMMDPAVRSPRAEYLKPIDKVEATDAVTLKITLKQAFNIVPLLAQGWMLMLPPHVIQAKGDMKKDIMGTGPFRFKDYAPGVMWRVEKNKDYFIKDRPYLDGITIYIIKDGTARAAAFRTGNVHVTMTGSGSVTPGQVDSIVKAKPATQVFKTVSLNSAELSMNQTAKPWDDVRVRKAADLAVDREAGIKVLEGQAYIASHFPDWGVPNEELLKMPGWRPPKEDDRAQARKLLADAGYPNGFKGKMLVKSSTDMMRNAQFLQDQLRTVGIDLTLDVQDATIITLWEQEGKFETFGRGNSRYLLDPYDVGKRYVTGAHRAGASGAPPGYSSPKYDELYYKQGSILDETERKKVVKQMDQIALDEVPALLFLWNSITLLASEKLNNYKPGFGSYNNFRWQNVWLSN